MDKLSTFKQVHTARTPSLTLKCTACRHNIRDLKPNYKKGKVVFIFKGTFKAIYPTYAHAYWYTYTMNTPMQPIVMIYLRYKSNITEIKCTTLSKSIWCSSGK